MPMIQTTHPQSRQMNSSKPFYVILKYCLGHVIDLAKFSKIQKLLNGPKTLY
jgi:hypothetical protein